MGLASSAFAAGKSSKSKLGLLEEVLSVLSLCSLTERTTELRGSVSALLARTHLSHVPPDP